MVTSVWLSAAVEKISDFRVGIVVLRSMSFVLTPPEGLDAEGQRGHVEEQDVLHLSLDDGRLDGRAHGDALHRVDAALDLLAEEVLDELLDRPAFAWGRRP